MTAIPDPTTQSNYLSITTQHVHLDWSIDFVSKTISGSAIHSLIAKENVGEVIFDCLDIDVQSVEVEGKTVEFSLGDKNPVMGSALRISLPSKAHAGDKVTVKVTYNVGSEAFALQFLDKEQTQGGRYPFLFSQCQPIYARSFAPLQDTPSVKLTYSAKVSSTLPVLMSAIRVSPPSSGPVHAGKKLGEETVLYEYNQPTPIPSYLIAIACGHLVYKPIDTTDTTESTAHVSVGIWAEPELIEAAHWEFSADTRRFLQVEEGVVGKYRFGVYDLLVLPPSFPYGGMENACLSFLTPTLLAGDRTLVDVVVHELTHSWFGNGVTHTDASHFWLNEGWTTYIERVLQQLLHGRSPARRGFSYLIGRKALQRSLEEFAEAAEKTKEEEKKKILRYQRLVIDFEKGEDPDDAYSRVPYEKGSNLLLYLERLLGGLDVFLPYIRDYVDTFMGRSIDTTIWKEHLYGYWSKTENGEEKIKLLDSVDWDAWLYGEGLSLPVEPEYDLTLAEQAYDLAKRWDASRSIQNVSELDFKSSDLDELDSNQKIVFLERLQSYPNLPSTHLTHLGSLYGVRETSNSEIRYRFYELALINPSSSQKEFLEQVGEEAAKWVVGEDGTGILKGRMKFCRPVLRAAQKAIAAVGAGDGGEEENVATSIYKRHRLAFHPIARRLIEKDLGEFAGLCYHKLELYVGLSTSLCKKNVGRILFMLGIFAS
ncbi:leukotriene-A4 hydrolase [Pyrrhoderma noxium]|uniref:Leukotriene-A4 hydrolase n=1 Tax=Pyrrhoderma noxium TaxID=2282107 RepID=A0A286UQ40_9AGAM|nr:leukotriene-A4 hydrolase [Pyrrhoderma noxium]